MSDIYCFGCKSIYKIRDFFNHFQGCVDFAPFVLCNSEVTLKFGDTSIIGQLLLYRSVLYEYKMIFKASSETFFSYLGKSTPNSPQQVQIESTPNSSCYIFVKRAIITSTSNGMNNNEVLPLCFQIMHLSDIYTSTNRSNFDGLKEVEGTLQAFLTDIIYIGSEFINIGDEKVAGKITFTVNSYKFNLTLLSSLAKLDSLAKDTSVRYLTSKLSTRSFQLSNEIILYNILSLLRLYFKGYLVIPYLNILSEEEIITVFKYFKEYPYRANNFIDRNEHRGKNLSKFISECYVTFSSIKDSLQLNHTIELLCSISGPLPMELKLLLYSVCLEHINDRYIDHYISELEHEETKMEQKRHLVRKRLRKYDIDENDDFIDHLAADLYGFHSFRYLLLSVLQHLSVRHDDIDLTMIIKNRNKIVHEMKFHQNYSSFPQKLSVLKEFETIVERIIVKVIGYTGKHVDPRSI